MSNPFHEDWKSLQQFRTSAEDKNTLKHKIRLSLRNQNIETSRKKRLDWKNLVLTCLFLLISGGILSQLPDSVPKELEPGSKTNATVGSGFVHKGSFSWEPGSVTSKKIKDGYAIYHNDASVQVGKITEVSENEQQKIVYSKPISFEKEYQHFPYPTHMYIEHVKMADVVLRYHFFVVAANKTFHFSLDYPKLDHSDIFSMMATLVYSEQKPYIHHEPLFVTHGYDDLPYPVGLKVERQDGENVEYLWEEASQKAFTLYIEKIEETGRIEINKGTGSHTFESQDGNQIVKLTLDGKQLTYEFSYPNRED
ncbi:hypothetical protein [Bacillus sp. REN3]|uniref:hypothetical protein n=1 Tax=Bacillus sp. REN3 TaxID=2802440 RepID=UPI001AEE09CE|nr:hypothetical protein [Bacillus sp. REN3]